MPNEIELRTLLEAAGEVVNGVLRAANATPYAQWSRDQHQAEIVRERIDAALAEPIEDMEASASRGWQMADSLHLSVKEQRERAEKAERERDEARAEAEKAFRRGAAAMREAVLYRLNPDPLKPPLARGFSLWDEIKHTPIPEDK
jgi:hypothetical protein